MFSKRNWFTVTRIIQIDSLDEESRRAIWDIFYLFTKWRTEDAYNFARKIARSEFWFNQTLEEFESYNPSNKWSYGYSNINAYNLDSFVSELKGRVHHEEYYKVFDLIELFTSELKVQDIFNEIFKKYAVWYRFSATNEIVWITNEVELDEVNNTQSLPTISKKHFENAISEFSKRKDVNYKLVARESIDWLESLLRELVGNTKITLWQAINKIQSDQKYLKYTRLFDGLDKIWAFANDQLRHAEKSEESSIWFHDAKFILVLASSMANYINSIK